MKTLDLAKACADDRLLMGSFSQRTADAFQSTIRTFVKRTGVELLEDITEDVVKAFFVKWKKDNNWKANTQLNYYKYLKNLIIWCIENEYMNKHDNPLKHISRPKLPKALPRRLSTKNACNVMDAAINYDWTYRFEKKRNPAMIATLLYSGLRISELLNLKISDVDLDESNITVINGKFSKDRHVPICPKLHTILTSYEAYRDKFGKTSTHFFCSAQSNNKLTYKAITRIFKRIREKSGVYCSPHMLRHTFASIAVENGIPLPSLQEIMGHTAIESTMVYIKISHMAKKEALRKIEWPY